jgi:hypothetical protein
MLYVLLCLVVNVKWLMFNVLLFTHPSLHDSIFTIQYSIFNIKYSIFNIQYSIFTIHSSFSKFTFIFPFIFLLHKKTVKQDNEKNVQFTVLGCSLLYIIILNIKYVM